MFGAIPTNGCGCTGVGKRARPANRRFIVTESSATPRPHLHRGDQIMTRTANEVAEFLGCILEGDGAAPLSGVASPDAAVSTDLIYVENERHLEGAAASKASCVVAKPGLKLEGKTLLRAAHPKCAFARAAEFLSPVVPIAKDIHPTA